ncbi:Na+/H+ antiporter subunit E [Celeribacter litoreus]|uniref:Na+/H+ antiporter subunit E n=1 Tax=Celeribacter litoreus TaxID=2876714 RepID=UPI001CCF6882|nr:Na+/H+ antiporter subunit E [Celeribacter litoreus]MCA0043269.1 Na+/H+ antiporter subunit E [Celeribacter litoreus]
MSDTHLADKGQTAPPPLDGLSGGVSLRLFATLFLFWVLLNASLSFATILSGLVVAGVISAAFGRHLSFLSGFNLAPAGIFAAFQFIGYFLKELVKANLSLAALVMKPSLPISPAIVKVRTTLTDPVARLLLANAITLTPGTLTCEIKGEFLYIHWVVTKSTDLDEATQEIVAGFERYLEVMYG